MDLFANCLENADLNTGKELRLRRLIDIDTGTSVMFAFSHGTSSPEVLPGLENPAQMVSAAVAGGADCIFLGPGMVNRVRNVLAGSRRLSLVVKVTATASRGIPSSREVSSASVQQALRLGADGIVALLALAPENESEVIRLAATLGEDCASWGVPFIAEAEFPSSYSPNEPLPSGPEAVSYLMRSARLFAELGADIIKSNWTGSTDSFQRIVEAVPVPIVVAGGSRDSDLVLLEKLRQAMQAGAIGCSVGRNVFQHPQPERFLSAICGVIRDGKAPYEALSDAEIPVANVGVGG